MEHSSKSCHRKDAKGLDDKEIKMQILESESEQRYWKNSSSLCVKRNQSTFWVSDCSSELGVGVGGER